jgi:aryl-alcohol dehydrogenase-like predicted oxidoreductase
VDDSKSIRASTMLRSWAYFFDAANVYGAGHSERVFARAIAGKHEEIENLLKKKSGV